MNYCDVCNSPLDHRQGFTVSALDFNKLLDVGFGIDEYNIKMITDTGVTRIDAIELLMTSYRTSTSDWLLCEKCGSHAQAKIPTIILRKLG